MSTVSKYRRPPVSPYPILAAVILLLLLGGCSDLAVYNDNIVNATSLSGVSALDLPATMIYRVAPTYPAEALLSRIEAAVWVRALVDDKGNVREAIAVKTTGYGFSFDQNAILAAYRCKYSAAVKDGQPTSARVQYVERFNPDTGVRMEDFTNL